MIYSALLLGFLGSFHCLGMCAPIAISMPFSKNSTAEKWMTGIQYNMGRILTYMLLGGVVGFVGQLFSIAYLQFWLTSFVGALFIIVGLMAVNLDNLVGKLPIAQKVFTWVTKNLVQLLQKPGGSFLAGALNGLLPCGLVYMALVAALGSGTWELGIAYMYFFGMGTLPAMLFSSIAGQSIKAKWRTKIVKLYPYAFVMLGLTIMLRSYFIYWEAGTVNQSVICF